MNTAHGAPSWIRGLLVLLGAAALILAPHLARAAAFDFRANLDLVVTDHGDGAEYNYLWGDSQLNSYRLRMFATATVSEHLDFFGEALGNDDVGVVPFGAYATFHPSPGKDVHVQAGLIPWPIGDWAPRATSDKNPLVGLPLMYQYHTTLRQDVMPATADDLLAVAGQGEHGVDYGSGYNAYGMPIVYDQWWDFGAALLGSSRPFEYSIGFVNGSPGYSNPGEDHTPGKSVLGRVGLAPTPGLRFGVSGSYGPYLDEEEIEGTLAPGVKVDDFNQVLRMADLQYSVGHANFHAEGFVNTWETPTLGNLNVRGGFGELKYKLPRGFYMAGRYSIMRFSDVVDSTGASRSWDSNVDRIEVGGGYRVTHGVIAKLVWQSNVLQPPDPALAEEEYNVWAGQLSVVF